MISSKPLFEKREKQFGQSVVELALMLPLLILILVGVLDLARIYQAQVTITNAAREGARYAAIHPSSASAVQTRTAQEASTGGISPVTVTLLGLGQGAGTPVTVTVQYNFPMLTTYMFAGVSNIPIQASAVMQAQ